MTGIVYKTFNQFWIYLVHLISFIRKLCCEKQESSEVMTNQNSSFQQRYQPYIFDQFRQPDVQWDSTSSPNIPTVPPRGNKRVTPNEVSNSYHDPSWMTPHESAQKMDNNVIVQKYTRLSQNMNSTPADSNFRNPIGNTDHDVNVNHVQSPQRSCSKYAFSQWFHGKISRDEAENLLRPRSDGLFLIRESTNFPGDYTLCVCFQSKVEHYRIKSNKDRLTIDDEEFFDNLEELIEHYKNDADGLCTKLVNPLSKDYEALFSNNTKSPVKEIDDLFVIPEQELTVSVPPLADVVKHVEKGYQMEEPEGCPPEVYEIMRQAWDLNPEKRPNFHEVKIKLGHLKQQITL
nr:tyrosine-protein kinase CSK-like [Leptinotarsa decemlineata]